MELGSDNRIGEVRARKGLKQSELAEKLGMSRGQLANLESGTRKVDLPELRRIAKALGCQVIDLLLPDDAPNQPSADEIQLLTEIRNAEGYDARALLAAAQAVVSAVGSVKAVQTLPRNIEGDPVLARELLDRWGNMDDGGRKKALQLLDAAREFSH